MTEHEASRTLVKSPPELWAECSGAASLARHLGQFGEIRITRLEPETAVAWEGEEVSGTVRLEPSGWGTRVILTARASGEPEVPVAEPELKEEMVGEPAQLDESESGDEPPPPPDPEPDPLPPAAAGPSPVAATPADTTSPRPVRRTGLFARLVALFQPPEPAPVPLVSASPPAPPTTASPASTPPPSTSTPPPTPRPAAVPRPAARSPQSVTPVTEPDVPEPPDPDVVDGLDHAAVLTAALDSLGQAHHRPYSRA
jgi:hypothetical protein